MKPADEMFEELGYEKKVFGRSKISYSKTLDFEGFCVRTIEFDKRKN